MSESPSPLRRRMIEDMTVRNFVRRRTTTISARQTFTTFLGRRRIRRAWGSCLFQLHQTQTGVVRRASMARLRAAFLLHRDARPPRDGTPPHVRAGATQIPVI